MLALRDCLIKILGPTTHIWIMIPPSKILECAMSLRYEVQYKLILFPV